MELPRVFFGLLLPAPLSIRMAELRGGKGDTNIKLSARAREGECVELL